MEIPNFDLDRIADYVIYKLEKENTEKFLSDGTVSELPRHSMYSPTKVPIQEREFEFISKFNDLDKKFMPRRSTEDSAGYDFICITEQVVPAKSIAIIKTGIKVKVPKNEFLMLCNRSSNPKKKGLILANGIGVVDADYYNNEDNEGEIGFMFYNMKDEDVTFHVEDKIGQGIFVDYKKTNSNLTEHKVRTGGFGSTGK